MHGAIVKKNNLLLSFDIDFVNTDRFKCKLQFLYFNFCFNSVLFIGIYS